MKKEVNYFYSVLAFIDILGQQDRLMAIDKLTRATPMDLSKLEKLDEETAGFVEIFRTDFNNWFNTHNQQEKMKIDIPDNKRQLFDEMNKSKLEIQVFSDCIQGYTSLETDKYHSQAINGVFGLLMACGSMMYFSFARKKAIRIGIDVGLSTKLSNGEIYGPALYKAHCLEEGICQYPRIVIGNDLIEYLKTLSDKRKLSPNQEQIDLEWCKKIADLCLQMTTVDIDGVHIFNYLGKTFVMSVIDEENQVKINDIFEPAYQFVEEEYQRFKKESNQKLAQRYFLLISYFQKAKDNLKEWLE